MPKDLEAVSKRLQKWRWRYLRDDTIQVYLSETMADTKLEMRPTENDTFVVIYRNFKIATVDAVAQKLLDRHIRRL